MSLLAALFLAAASARVEAVSLTTLDSRLAVRVLVSGTPGLVAVHREGDVARVSIMDADLGLRFAGGRRFSWTPSDGFDPALLAATPAKLDQLEIAAGTSEVSVLLHVPPEVSVDVRRDPRGLLVIFRAAGEPERVARTARAPEPVWPAATPPVATEPLPARARVEPRAAPAPTAELVPAPVPPAPVATSAPASSAAISFSTSSMGVDRSVSEKRDLVLFRSFQPIRSCLFHPLRGILALTTDSDLVVFSISEGRELLRLPRGQA